jgi:HD-like signal output (HDOD) protein
MSSERAAASSRAGSAPDSARAASMKFLTNLAKDVSSGTVDLPCFPDVVIRVRKALSNPNTNPKQVVMIVGTEPRLAAKLLQTANSAAFNPAGKPLTDLRSAITRIGHQMVQSATMAFALQQMKDAEQLYSIAQKLSELWKESISVASISQVVAKRTAVKPDEAFLTGLLHGMGRLYVMVRAVGQSDQLLSGAEFVELVSSWEAAIGKAVLENWGFAEEMAGAVGNQGDYSRMRDDPADLTDVLIVSKALSGILHAPERNLAALYEVDSFRTIGLREKDCTEILLQAETQLGSLHDALGC